MQDAGGDFQLMRSLLQFKAVAGGVRSKEKDKKVEDYVAQGARTM